MCETNKGIYIKAGQFVSATKHVPKEYSTSFSILLDQSLPYDFKYIKQVLINNLGPNCLADNFLSFDEDPVSAASIAQVHHAVLKNRKEVAVKLMYPGLEYQMKFDLVIMSLLSKLVGWIFPEYRFHCLVSEFEKSIASELDFIAEGKNLERVKENFKGNCMVRVPNVYWEFTTKQVLTMEFCRGRKVDDLDFMKQRGISEVKVAKTLAEVFAEMIFVHGFVHGDLHPGNILVSPEGKNGGFCLVLLDFGICKQLDEDFRLKYCELWEALVVMDSMKIQEIGEYFGVGKYSRYFPVIFTGRTIDSKTSLGRGMSVEEKKNLKLELKSLKMEDISSFMESLPTDFLTVLRTDGLLRSLISKLGVSARVRLLAYAEYAHYGLSLKADDKSDSAIGVMLFRFKTGLRYVQLRLLFGVLRLVSWLESIKHTSTRRFKDLLAAAGYVVRNFYHPLLTA